MILRPVRMMVDSRVLSLFTTRNSISPLRSSILAFAETVGLCEWHCPHHAQGAPVLRYSRPPWGGGGRGKGEKRTLFIGLQPLGLLLRLALPCPLLLNFILLILPVHRLGRLYPLTPVAGLIFSRGADVRFSFDCVH